MYQPGVTTIEQITELDLIATQNPTSVWLLNSDREIDDLKLYEQWEQGRPFVAKAIYHHPSGANFYLKNSDDPFGVNTEDAVEPYELDELSLAPERPGKRHQVAEGEDIYSIGLYYKTPWQKILEHNELEGADSVKPGMWLYIPPYQEPIERQNIEYRLLDEPRPMHVSHINGTTKYSFGNVKKWPDIKSCLKHYEENQNVDIVAIAKVPVEDTIAAYYMDRHDLGMYRETGRVAYTRGFNWQHLAEGHITVEKPVTKVQQIVADAMAEDNRPALPEKQEIAPPPVEREMPETLPTEEATVTPLEVELDEYKATFQYLNVEESPERYTLLENIEVRELDGALPARPMKAGQSIMVSGWFVYKDTPYYRVATRYWYAIPTQLAYSVENEPFNDFTVDLPTRVAYGLTLSKEEQKVERLARLAARYNRLKSLGGMLRRK